MTLCALSKCCNAFSGELFSARFSALNNAGSVGLKCISRFFALFVGFSEYAFTPAFAIFIAP